MYIADLRLLAISRLVYSRTWRRVCWVNREAVDQIQSVRKGVALFAGTSVVLTERTKLLDRIRTAISMV